MTNFMQNILLISWMCSLVILLMLLIRKASIKHTSAWWRTAIWMLILVRMCLPFTVQTHIGLLDADVNTPANQDAIVYEYTAGQSNPASNNAVSYEHQNTVINIMPASQTPALNVINILTVLYFIGFAVSLLLLIVKAVSQQKYIAGLSLCKDQKILDLLAENKKQMGIRHNISVVTDNSDSMPMVYGLIKPKIILPVQSAKCSLDELNLIISHELMHIKQLDILKLWIIELTACVHWFNPVIYYIKKIINEDIELSCDQKVIKGANKFNVYEYSRIIAEYSTKHKFSNLVLSSGIYSTGNKAIKTRLTLIKRNANFNKLPSVFIAIIAVIFLTACTTFNLTNALPSSFDWRDRGVITQVQDQGEYASGSVFAAVSLMESNIAIYDNQLVNLSEQHYINNPNNTLGDTGVAPSAVLDYLCQNGTVTEQQVPYTGIQGNYTDIDTDYFLSSWSYVDLGQLTQEERVEQIKLHLVEYGPVITPITFYSDLIDYSGGVYQWDGVSQADYGHWLTIVGYQDDSDIASGGYWVAKESWGTQWGEEGYIRIAYNDACGIDDYTIYYAEKPDT